MRASTCWQRNLAGKFSLRSSVTRLSHCNLQHGTIARPIARFFYIKTDPRPDLSEFFSRVQWPTTKAEETELVESVRAAIWEGQNGGMLHSFLVALSISAANQGSRQNIDKRARAERQAEAKRQKIENGEEVKAPVYATEFSKEEIANEERRPKKKAAVLLGYSGTGYHGMQMYVLSLRLIMKLSGY